MRLTYPRILIIGVIGLGILIGLVYTVNLAFYYAEITVNAGETTADYVVEFTASRGTILNKGDCVTLSWDADRIAGIYFEEQGRVPESVERCPNWNSLPKTYILEIEHVDGTQSSYPITITRTIASSMSILFFIFVVLLGLWIAYVLIQRDGWRFAVRQPQPSSPKLRNLAYTLVIITPISATTFLFVFFHGFAFNDVMPVSPDDYFYWHQAASFIEAGFDSGYYSVDEIPSDAEFSSFYAWGAGIPILYGTIGSIFGWSLHSIRIINLVLLTLAIMTYLIVVRPTLHQTLLLWLLLTSFTLMYAYSVRNMLPLQQQALAIVMAAFFSVLLRKGREAPLWAKVGLALSIAVAVIMRSTYGLLWLPYLLLVFPRISPVVSVLGSIVLLGVGVRLQTWWSSNYPLHIDLVFQEIAQGGFVAGFELAWSVIVDNIHYLMSFNVDSVTVAHRLAMLIILIVSITFIVRWFQQGKWHINDVGVKGALFCVYSLLVPYSFFSALVVLSIPFHELRYVTPFFLMGMAVLIAIGQHRYNRLAILPLVFIFPITIHLFYNLSSLALDPAKTEQYEVTTAIFNPVLQWDEDAPNRWCNTVLIENPVYIQNTALMIAIDPGLGLSWSGRNDLPDVNRFRSAYVMLTDEMAPDVLPGKNLEPIADVLSGKLYRNWDSDCDVMIEE